MKKILFGVISLFMILSSLGYAKSTFRYNTTNKIGYYCTKVNQTDPVCRQYIQYKKKLNSIKFMIRKKIRKYCKIHPNDVVLCKNSTGKPKTRTLGFQ